jgi:2-keto-4-pentenoate hydratase/2-oxohepta-3-ene-1,7-dioic acid hydratase in catechol pathway
MSTVFSLDAGDVILTGTPKGVGPLKDGDTVAVSLDPFFSLQTKVIV